MTIIWCMVPEIWSRTEFSVISDDFLLFYPTNNLKNQYFEKLKTNTWRYYHFAPRHHNWQLWCWDMECNRISCHFRPFLPFYPLIDHRNQNFQKMNKKPEDIIILQMFTINNNHMMHGSSDMESSKQNFLSFLVISCSFTPVTIHKIKILKKWKKTTEDVIILQKCTINDNHIMYSQVPNNRHPRLLIFRVFPPRTYLFQPPYY